MKKHLMIFGLLLVALAGIGQTAQTDYLEAKRLFTNGQFLSAKAAFGALVEHEDFGKHASFYFALSAYKLGDYQTAKDMFRQVLVQFPAWDQEKEVLYWMARANFETGDYQRALDGVKELASLKGNSRVEEELIKYYLNDEELVLIKSLYEQNDDNPYLAELLIKKLIQVPYENREFDQITELASKWDFDLYEMDPEALPVIKKSAYNLAVVLPFLYEGLDNTNRISQNKLIMDMYQGMLMAQEDLDSMDMPVSLFPYDTKRRAQYTENILSSQGFAAHDVIIGPLYQEPSNLVRSFAQENQILHFNPLLSNSDAIGNSSFSFLIRPTYETQALELAELAVKERPNEYAMIFYERSERDSIFAATFKSRLEKDSVEVIWFQPITKQNSRRLLDTLSAQYDVFLTQPEADSIRKMQGRFVKDRRLRKEELRKIERDTSFFMPISYDSEDNPIVFYEKRFYMEPDSVGTIFAATRSNLFANNLISAVEARNDSIKLYGLGEWLDFTMLTYSQLDRLNVTFSEPDYYDRYGKTYEQFVDRFVQTFKAKPSVNHIRGYETVFYIGNMLHRYGKNFQRGLRSGEFVEGKIFEGFKYGASNDNQVVPIVRFDDAKLKVVNREMYENREE